MRNHDGKTQNVQTVHIVPHGEILLSQISDAGLRYASLSCGLAKVQEAVC
ncbi:hypothetical protein H6F42_09535 [Pseudanabaena sp. FACHB-1998]|nr:hypothetical protein [Pseudanabaena sp. FACHB-1998]MBD2177150.1 hypothetical protein [Pseudanabaena sp. FACHB-1998]